MKSLKFKNLELASPLMLSPMAGFTNLPFRAAVRSLGGLSIATTDLVNARSILELNYKAIRMISAAANDRPLGVQLFGANRGELRDAARFLEDLGIDLIDINMGCPSDKVNACGAGAALMQDEELTEELIAAIVNAVSIPVTVKMRLGWDEDSINAHLIAPRLEQMGVAAVAVHGRTRMQGYTGKVNLPAIREVVKSVKRIPVIGNGDVSTHLDAARMINEVGCSGVMVGRAALWNPFFFSQTLRYLQTGEEPREITLRQMMLFMHYHFAMMLHFYGEEDACRMFRTVIPGYSEHFSHKARWRVEMQHLETVDEYLEIVARLADAALDDECLRPRLEVGYLRELLGANGEV
ncbi:MAG: tRNA dihydrouridine synthase DusB [Verrucomicrobiales bacterium]|jgi:nifR3 family TIM-barrel protein|nr:tRNA dihydrouridine synthase DusB [Verrucomicrobiales bacterium]